MDIETALKVLGEDTVLQEDEGKVINMVNYINWRFRDSEVTLDGEFSLEQLKALVFIIENKQINK